MLKQGEERLLRPAQRVAVVSRALAVVGAVLVVSACGGVMVTSDRDRGPEARAADDAAAYSVVDGVETWDLTGAPSDAAFGIERPSSAAIYETPDPRPVRILLPGRTVETEAVLVDFHAPARGGDYTFGVRSAELEPEPLTAVFRDVLDQLGLDDTLATEFAHRVDAAPDDQPEAIEVGVGVKGAVVLGRWTVGPSVNLAPLAGSGRVVLSGSWGPR